MYLHKLLKSILFLALIAILTACGNAHDSTNNDSSTKAEISESATKIIKTKRGDLEMPSHPQRIVTDGYLPELLVLGVKPIGSTQWDLENKVIQDQIDGIESTGERSLETIVQLKPDLIITWASDEKILQQYEKIAPTLAIPYSSTGDIYETMRLLGDALDKKDEAEQWIKQFDQTAEEARAQLADIINPNDTFALMGVFVVDKGFYIYGDGGYRGGEAIYKHLQLKPPAKQEKEMIGKEAYRQISYEVIPEYAGDYIFIDQGDLISEVWGESEGLWKSLDAVKNNRVFKLDPDLFWGNDPISLELQIKEIVNMLSQK
ncbi:ABC transporter substrate-binding protein [Lysinibacillus sp. FSL H8-0500]|uniref:ABC transporter substrate-binding protein n=1 Tax=Lysinibacillus sp. FSL H8-0500 TaxID=2921393 RepID=UPI003100D761